MLSLLLAAVGALMWARYLARYGERFRLARERGSRLAVFAEWLSLSGVIVAGLAFLGGACIAFFAPLRVSWMLFVMRLLGVAAAIICTAWFLTGYSEHANPPRPPE